MKEKLIIEWVDSYGVLPGWQEIGDYTACELVITSVGFKIYENDKVIALAHNYAEETDNTPEQANGIMVIPKVCIKKTIKI